MDTFLTWIAGILSVAGAGGCTYLFWKYYESHGLNAYDRHTSSKFDIFGRKLVLSIITLIGSFLAFVFILLSLFGLNS